MPIDPNAKLKELNDLVYKCSTADATVKDGRELAHQFGVLCEAIVSDKVLPDLWKNSYGRHLDGEANSLVIRRTNVMAQLALTMLVNAGAAKANEELDPKEVFDRMAQFLGVADKVEWPVPASSS